MKHFIFWPVIEVEHIEITGSGWAGEVWDDLEPNLQTIDNLLAV